MRRTTWRSSTLLPGVLAVLTLVIAAAQMNVYARQARASRAEPSRPEIERLEPQYDQDRARPRDLVALQDDLNLLDDSLAEAPKRHTRLEGLERRAADIRADASALADRVSRNGMDSREGGGATRTEVVALRQRIAALLEDAEKR